MLIFDPLLCILFVFFHILLLKIMIHSAIDFSSPNRQQGGQTVCMNEPALQVCSKYITRL